MSNAWITRAENNADIPIVREINSAAFPTAEEADLVDALRSDQTAWIDALSIVAADHTGTLIGHALLTRCHIGETPALCLGPCAVRPSQQSSRGAGSAAIRAALQAAIEVGERYVVVLGHSDYYPRFGFGRASTHGIGVPFKVPDESLMALSLNANDPLPSGTVRYAAAFGI